MISATTRAEGPPNRAVGSNRPYMIADPRIAGFASPVPIIWRGGDGVQAAAILLW